MRFVVHESSGRLGIASSAKPPGTTYSVHDSWVLYRTVGLFRSEDEQYGNRTRAVMRAVMHTRARAQAHRLAALLNGDYAA